jgi:hypothetical protein
MKIAWETLAAAILVAVCISFVDRYQISTIGYGGPVEQGVYRLDRWTGEIDVCPVSPAKEANTYQVECPAGDPVVQKTN